MLELRGPMSFGVSRGINRRRAESEGHDALIIDLTHAHLLGVTSGLASQYWILSKTSRQAAVVYLLQKALMLP